MLALGTLVALILMAAPSPGPDDLDAAWRARGDPAGRTRALAAYQSAAQAPGAGLQVFERLVRLRFFEADSHPDRSDAKAAGYRLCVADGLRGLSRLGAPDGTVLELPDVAALHDARNKIGVEAAGLFFATTVCYGSSLLTLSIFDQAPAAKRFKRLLERAVALDATVLYGGPRRSLALYLLKAPGIMGGDDKEARRQAEAAYQVNSRYAYNVMVRAVVVHCPARSPACETELRAATELPEDAVPELVPEQRRAQRLAREELARRSGR
jgi:hypothetical protein